MRVLVTGSSGFIGKNVLRLLRWRDHTPIPFDHPRTVLDPFDLADIDCDAAIHLAAHKHAGHGELHPEQVATLNITGTANVVRAAPRVILASTCKAAAPITCYGASKLIAERIVLNEGGTVVRLVNVLGSSGSVTEIWDQIPAGEPLPVTNTERMYITPAAAARLFVDALDLEPGRYGPAQHRRLTTHQLAAHTNPHRTVRIVPLRLGDRPREQLTNPYETLTPHDRQFVRIDDCWTPTNQQVAA